MNITVPIVAVNVRLTLDRDAEGRLVGVQAAGPCDDTRAAIIAAVDAGLKRGRDLETQSLRTLGMRDLIYGLMDVQP